MKKLSLIALLLLALLLAACGGAPEAPAPEESAAEEVEEEIPFIDYLNLVDDYLLQKYNFV